jgi:hypothetical protein
MKSRRRKLKYNEKVATLFPNLPYEVSELILSRLHLGDLTRLQLVSKAHHQWVNDFFSRVENYIFVIRDLDDLTMPDAFRKKIEKLPIALTDDDKTIWQWVAECLTANVMTIDVKKLNECWEASNKREKIPPVISNLIDRQIKLIQTLQDHHHKSLHSSKSHQLRFFGEDLSNLNFSDAELEGAIFQFCSMQGSHLERSNLRGSYFVLSSLYGGKLESANLRNAVIHNTFLDDANLCGADITETQITPLDLCRSQLNNANFNLKHADKHPITLWLSTFAFHDQKTSDKFYENIIALFKDDESSHTYGLFHPNYRKRIKKFHQSILHQLEEIVCKLIRGKNCDLVLMSSAPNKDNLEDLAIKSDRGYILCGNHLFYVNKMNDECTEIVISMSALASFNQRLEPSEELKTLSVDEIKQIALITGHTQNDSLASMKLCRETLAKLNDQNVFKEHKKSFLSIKSGNHSLFKHGKQTRIDAMINKLDQAIKEYEQEYQSSKYFNNRNS